jgi:hypothetical protein
MAMTLSGDGTITGLVAGGLPDATITQPEMATGVAGTGPAFSAGVTSSTTISSATFTKVAFNVENWDTNNCYDNATNYRFTPTVAGYYMVTASVDAGNSTSASRNISAIYKNGSAYRYGNNLATAVNNTFNTTVSSLVYLNGSTDYIELYVYITAITAVYSASVGTWFDAVLVRAA